MENIKLEIGDNLKEVILEMIKAGSAYSTIDIVGESIQKSFGIDFTRISGDQINSGPPRTITIMKGGEK